MRRNTKLGIKAQKTREIGQYMETTGNATWRHEFYRMPMGNIVEISYNNGSLVEINNLGR